MEAIGLRLNPEVQDTIRKATAEIERLTAELRAHQVRREVHIGWPRSANKVGVMCGFLAPALVARDYAAAVGYEGTVCAGCAAVNETI